MVNVTNGPAMEREGAPGLPVYIHDSVPRAVDAVVREICDRLRAQPSVVLGFATGGTMVPLYAALVSAIRTEGIDASRLQGFNLDEYLGLRPATGRGSFAAFMHEHLGGPLGLAEGQLRLPDPLMAERDPLAAGRNFEDAIEAAGGIELQLLGLGRNGHIAFNEPGSPRASRTRVVDLDGVTRADNAGAFEGLDGVPRKALTMGIGTILEARSIRVLAFGDAKAEIVRETVQAPVSDRVPSTFLRGHADVALHVDPLAASHLPRP